MASPSSSKKPITPPDSPRISDLEYPVDPPDSPLILDLEYPVDPPDSPRILDLEYPVDPPPSSIPESLPYDVFLSFRGSDTRNNFTGHLYDRLVMSGIHTFMDDPELRRGREISLQLMRAIEESRTYIVVFSQNYASSKWCLNELVKIMDCHRKGGRVVLPVFYRVDPCEVRRPNDGSFAEAFENHEKRYATELNKVNEWKVALFLAANMSGFDLQTSALGSESRLISMIVKEVLSQVKPKRLFVAKHPVGLDSRLKDVYSLIRLESDDVRVFGIWGMGGSGKSVIAKALYNDIYQNFDLSCFFANVREVSHQPNGLVRLQEQLISELVKGQEVKVDNVDIGIEMIRARFRLKKVLIILDDLDDLRQLNALAGDRNWYGGGSVIIITTRDRHLLTEVQVDGRYEANQLNKDEALELFSWHSFKKGFPEEPYAVIADKIVAYSCGLPVALVVLGSYLLGRPIQEWNSAFEKLQKIPPAKIQEILKISYDGLDDDEQREIFLDIACFFIGMDIDYVTEILNGCNFSTEIAIGILNERCLLTVDRNNELRMHDLLRDMGREIIREPFPKEPGKRSRLWSHQDVTNVLTRNMGTEAIEGVTLASPIKEEIHLDTMNFSRMHKLRLLRMDNVNLNGNFEHLSKVIKWISWQDCPLKHLPSNLQLENLVALDMKHSKMSTIWQQLHTQVSSKTLSTSKFSWISRLWPGNQVLFSTLQMENLVALDMKHGKMTTVWQGNHIQILRHLKILDLSHSKCLTSTPDFTRVPSLVTLILEDCTSLLQIEQSIGCLRSLLVLNLKGCKKITTIASEICSLRSLGYLHLSGCSNLKELPRDIGDIESLRDLYADETVITCLPPSLELLRNLTRVSLSGCTKMSGNANALLSIVRRIFRSMRRLNLRDCNLFDEDIPNNMGYQVGLQELDLAGNRLSKLPSSFERLVNLESLWLDDWSILQSLPYLPPNLEALMAKNINAAT